MKITFLNKINIFFSMYSAIPLLPSRKKKIATLLRPIDTVRFFEFAYLKKFITKRHLKNLNILDVSSPHMMAYYLSKNNHVIKTDIDSDEKKFIKEHDNLIFKIEDGTKLTFPDNTFDLTYSISVIEHIYEGYTKAINEMIRVTKKEGYIYVTFPVSNQHKEVWFDNYVYSHQAYKEGKSFFSYYFGEKEVANLLNNLTDVEIQSVDIFWEREAGLVDKVTKQLHYKFKNPYITFIKDVVLNNYYGFHFFRSTPEKNFTHSKPFGNLHLVLKKK